MNVEKSFTIPDLEALSPGEIIRALSHVPSHAGVAVDVDKAERNGFDQYNLTFTWSEQIGGLTHQ